MSTDPDGELQESQDRTALVVAQKELLTAQKELLISQRELLAAMLPQFPAGKAGVLDVGQGSVDPLHARIRAYHALEDAVKKLCRLIGDHPQGTVVLSPDDLKFAGQYRVAQMEAARLSEAYKVLATSAGQKAEFGAASIAGAVAALASILDLSRLFRTDRTLYGEATDIQPDELLDLVVKKLTNAKDASKSPVHYPAAEVEEVIASGEGSFLQLLKQLDTSRGRADAEIREIESTPVKQRSQPNVAKLAQLKSVVARHETFVSALGAADAASMPHLFNILRGEIVVSHMTRKDVRTLTARIARQGGVSMITSHALRSNKLYSSGGVVISYRVMVDGKFKDAGNVSAERPFTNVSLSTNECKGEETSTMRS